VSLLGILAILWGALAATIGVAMLLLSAGALIELLAPLEASVGFAAGLAAVGFALFGIFALVFGGAHIWAGARLRGHKPGGRILMLALAIAIHGEAGIHAIAGDTDGVDGQEEIAGALLTPDTLARAWAQGLKPRERLDDNDGHGFFEALGDAVITGPTLTNVNDFRAIVIAGRDPAAGGSDGASRRN